VPGYPTPTLECVNCKGAAFGQVLGHTFDRPSGSTFSFVPIWKMQDRPGSTEALAGIRVFYEHGGAAFSFPISRGAWLCWSTSSYECADNEPSALST
jgi:hypothetical protein